ncbi:HINT domain-containing protein [Actinoplanes sp. NBC_00393]|uniref:polymorphic toxin-type HINT domain-containing protein n=1 Tax=Actinoplanes sp. NBC_00393 TaxID=2975953 RepID=UPI002E21F926
MTASLAAVLLGTLLHAPPALALAPAPAASESTAPTIQIPPLVTESWNGTTGVDLMAERWRKAVADIAALTPEPEVRDAALAALTTGDSATIQKFATVDKPALDKQVAARKKQEAADNLAKIQALKGTGGPYFNAEVERVLAGTDSDRAAFLAYGADITRDRDAKVAADAAERAATLRKRVELIAATAPAETHVKRAAQAAANGDDAAINAFLATGYLEAAKADAAEREQYLKDLEARNKAAEELTDLAQKSAKANAARTRLLAAHGESVRALQQASNAMAAAANAARHATRVLAGSGTAASKSTELAAANAETKRQLGYAQTAATEAERSAQVATTAAGDIVETGLEYGVEWADISQGMSQAAAAAAGAAQTAAHATDATVATNNAQGAQAQAEAHAQQAIKWRQHAEEHAKSAAKLAAAAAKQATAAKTAAARTAKAREQAQAAERAAWAAAERTRAQREIAESQAAEAKRQRQIAEAERAEAERQNGIAQQQAAVARSQRAAAEAQAAVANAARRRADAADQAAGAAAGRAWDQEGRARVARDEAYAAERAEQSAKARAAALRAGAASAATEAERQEAQRQADQADVEAGTAGSAARSARSAANGATGAAANARAAANRAQQAAENAFAAAEAAEAAAAAADAAADKAEAGARQTHAARLRADAKAAEATAQEVKAARAAQAAVSLAEQAADEAVKALWAADRTKQEAEAATTEAVAAATQADIAVTAAAAARASSAGIAAPADTAIGMVSPFTGSDIDADFVQLVAEQAASIGAEQAAAASQRAAEALVAAQRAQEAADTANEQVKPAYTAAAQAARSAADAAASAAEAKKAAAQAAADGAAARTAAASARRADAQARADAAAARAAANAAANDARIAGQAAQAAQSAANAAASAATAAENDAAAARGAASRAEADAAAAQRAADSAQEYADSAKIAADSAVQLAAEAQQAAARAEEADRRRAAEALANGIADTGGLPEGEAEQALLESLTEEERAAYLAAKEEAGKGLMEFLQENAWELFEELSGLGDIKKCVMEGNVEACLWTLVGMLPIGKILGASAKLAKLAPKLLRFLDGVKAARRKVEELIASVRNRNGCPVLNLPRTNSFVPGTPVLLAGGASKPIEDIRVGDLVVATDPVTGVTRPERVLETFTRTSRKVLVDLRVDTDGAAGDRTATITATDNHPFWAPNLGEWVEAGDIIAGLELLNASGERVEVEAVRERRRWATVHNLSVANLHTYYVVPGGMAVLVHNVTPIPCGPVFPTTGTIPTRKPAVVGNANGSHDYKENFFSQNTEFDKLRGKVVVHHAIEQGIVKKYPGMFTADELHSVENLRGIPKGAINSNIHLSAIRLSWNAFYKANPNATKQQVLDHATKVDDMLGQWFEPRIR